MATKTFCDLCDVELKTNEKLTVSINLTGAVANKLPYSARQCRRDICPDCANKLSEQFFDLKADTPPETIYTMLDDFLEVLAEELSERAEDMMG